MAKRKHHTPEQIIHLLRQAEVELAGGQTVPRACRKLGVTEQAYYRWREEYGGCTSWVDLVEPLPHPDELKSEPALSDTAFGARMKGVNTSLGTPLEKPALD